MEMEVLVVVGPIAYTKKSHSHSNGRCCVNRSGNFVSPKGVIGKPASQSESRAQKKKKKKKKKKKTKKKKLKKKSTTFLFCQPIHSDFQHHPQHSRIVGSS